MTHIHETEYCIIKKRAQLDIDESRVAAIELITVKELERDETRFAYYKREHTGRLTLIPRPLDVTYEELTKLINLAREKNIMYLKHPTRGAFFNALIWVLFLCKITGGAMWINQYKTL